MDKIKKTIQLIKKNKESINQIIVCENFMLKIKDSSEVEFSSKEITKDSVTIEEYYLFEVPLLFSNILQEGAILSMKNGENIILKNI